MCPPCSECSPVLSVFLQYELWVALWYSECVKRKVVYQHVSLVVAACHPCRLLTLFIAFLPVLAALSECMKHDGTCIVIWPLHCYDLLYLARTIFVASTCRGVKLEQHCLQNTARKYPYTYAFVKTAANGKHSCLYIFNKSSPVSYCFMLCRMCLQGLEVARS